MSSAGDGERGLSASTCIQPSPPLTARVFNQSRGRGRGSKAVHAETVPGAFMANET